MKVCEHEESNMVAESVGISDWKKAKWVCEFDVDLSGYMGNVKTPMKAKDVFRKVFITCQPEGTSATAEQVQNLRKLVHATCPMARLFEAAGVKWEETWWVGGREEEKV